MNPMQTHVKVLGILHIVFGALGVLIGLGIFALFGGIAGIVQMENDPDAAMAVPILGAIGGFVMMILFVISVPGIIAGVGLIYYKSWARILAIVLSILELLNIPFGTALGIYGLWVLFNKEGSRLFEEGGVASPVQYQR